MNNDLPYLSRLVLICVPSVFLALGINVAYAWGSRIIFTRKHAALLGLLGIVLLVPTAALGLLIANILPSPPATAMDLSSIDMKRVLWSLPPALIASSVVIALWRIRGLDGFRRFTKAVYVCQLVFAVIFCISIFIDPHRSWVELLALPVIVIGIFGAPWSLFVLLIVIKDYYFESLIALLVCAIANIVIFRVIGAKLLDAEIREASLEIHDVE